MRYWYRWRSSANGGCVNGKQPVVGSKERANIPEEKWKFTIGDDSPLFSSKLHESLATMGGWLISMVHICRRWKTDPVQWFCYPISDADMGHGPSSIPWCVGFISGAKEYRLVGLALTKTLDMVCLGRWIQWKMEGGRLHKHSQTDKHGGPADPKTQSTCKSKDAQLRAFKSLYLWLKQTWNRRNKFGFQE